MADFWGAFLGLIGDPIGILLFFGALITGLLFAAMPGINMFTLCAILLPFTMYLSVTHAIMIYGVIYVAGTYGGAVMAILFNIPGSPENAPTALDGYQMTLQGKSGLAIGAAVVSSSLGGTLSAIVMMISAPILARWALTKFGPIEMFALIFFGLAVASSVGAKNQWKGYLSVVFGMLIATVGTDPSGGVPRYVFGTYYLYAGINFIPLVLGFFAITEVFVQGKTMMTATTLKTSKVEMLFPKYSVFWKLRWAIVRSCVVGFFAGILPGIGAILAAFLSYNIAVRVSRHPETFGKGDIEGVIAPEVANNAATGGAMIPMLALGLPGGAITAMMMSVFMMHGIEPGPLVMVTNKDLVWTVFVAMFLANLSIFVLGFIETRTIVQLLKIPFRVLAPAILLLSAIGSFAIRNSLLDVWVMFFAGIAGYFLRRSGYSMSSIVLGVILGSIGESFFVKSIQIMHYNWLGFFQRPISASLIVLGMLAIVSNVYVALKRTFSSGAIAKKNKESLCISEHL